MEYIIPLNLNIMTTFYNKSIALSEGLVLQMLECKFRARDDNIVTRLIKMRGRNSLNCYRDLGSQFRRNCRHFGVLGDAWRQLGALEDSLDNINATGRGFGRQYSTIGRRRAYIASKASSTAPLSSKLTAAPS